MKKHLLIQSLVVALPVLALTSTASANDINTELKSIYVPVHRVMMSEDGRYFLELKSGIWNPSARLHDQVLNQDYQLGGLQKGNAIELKGSNAEQPDLQLKGELNSKLGNMSSQLLLDGWQKTIHFQPLIYVENRPTFNFKFYGNNLIQRVDVLQRSNQQLYQSLVGFNADASQMQYIDLNFDGYFDLALKAATVVENENEQNYLYWMYNPKTAQFQRAAALEKLQGTPYVDAVKQEVHFGTQRFKVKSGLLHAVTD